MDERRPLRRQPDDHNFGSLLMLAVTAGAFGMHAIARHLREPVSGQGPAKMDWMAFCLDFLVYWWIHQRIATIAFHAPPKLA
jgi:hypothetical protein